MGCVVPLYRPRDAEHTVLHQVIAEHLEAFLGVVAEAGDGAGLPQFVEREFRVELNVPVTLPAGRDSQLIPHAATPGAPGWSTPPAPAISAPARRPAAAPSTSQPPTTKA